MNIYLYPKIDHTIVIPPNPYIFNLETSLSKNHNIVNKKYNTRGVLDLFRYIFKARIYLFNWIEDLPARRYGKLQIPIFVLFVYSSRLLGKKIVWTLHNKYSHNTAPNKWTDFMYKFLITKSDLILTHSQSGINFIKENYYQSASKVKYIIHPVQELIPKTPDEEKTYDFLIWGVIWPYKGILQFLKFISEYHPKPEIRILILGKCYDEAYKAEINKYLNDSIVHYDKFYEYAEILNFANRSKFILFTYKSDSVLSSGALMDSIRMRSLIIGPNDGAFKDLSSYNFMKTYKSYNDIIDIHNNYQPGNDSIYTEIDTFCKENSWDLFARKFDVELNKII